MSLWKRGRQYWADFTVDGRRYRKRLGTTNLQTARQKERQLIEDAGLGAVATHARGPKRLFEAQQLAVPAVISGHTHGGQIVLPGIGAVAAREFPVVAGVEQRQGTSIFVSRGVGTVYVPVRINCPPEVAILTLEPTLRS